MSGDTAAYSDRVATVVVGDITRVVSELERVGGTIIEAPSEPRGGTRLIARHPDGAVFEYIDIGDDG